MPVSFPDELKNKVRGYGCEVIEVKDALKICKGVATTGELGTAIKEQSLMIATQLGLIIVTGCAHPGVLTIVEKSIELTEMEIYLVIGGFHLTGASEKVAIAI